MALNSMTHIPTTGVMLDALRGPRAAAGAGLDRASARWPWPLPMDSVLAVFDDAGALGHTLVSLHAAGVTPDQIWTVSGKDGAATLRAAFSQRGALGRLRSLLGGEDEIVAQLVERCERGGAAVLIRQSRRRAGDIVAIATHNGARLVRRTGRWISEWTVCGA